jgi:hypothetical protein
MGHADTGGDRARDASTSNHHAREAVDGLVVAARPVDGQLGATAAYGPSPGRIAAAALRDTHRVIEMIIAEHFAAVADGRAAAAVMTLAVRRILSCDLTD